MSTQTDNPFRELIPPDPLMAAAWYSAVQAAVQHQPFIDAFKAETGLSWSAARSPIEQIIDEATGADIARTVAFVRWFNKNVWGDINEVSA